MSSFSKLQELHSVIQGNDMGLHVVVEPALTSEKKTTSNVSPSDLSPGSTFSGLTMLTDIKEKQEKSEDMSKKDLQVMWSMQVCIQCNHTVAHFSSFSRQNYSRLRES